jgi:putative acetyltransferase
MSSGGTRVRWERPDDLHAIRFVNEAAFGRSEEADLIDRLRVDGMVLASLVAEGEGRVVGHILFSRMWVETAGRSISCVALAPLAVLPDHQRRGIGGELVRFGLESLRVCGEHMVFVVGHPGYYPRFGFSSDRASVFSSPFPPDAFMALELSPGVLDGVRGTVRYPDAFGL